MLKAIAVITNTKMFNPNEKKLKSSVLDCTQYYEHSSGARPDWGTM